MSKVGSEKNYGMARAQVSWWSIAHVEMAITKGHLQNRVGTLQNRVGTFHYTVHPRKAWLVFKEEEDCPDSIGVSK